MPMDYNLLKQAVTTAVTITEGVKPRPHTVIITYVKQADPRMYETTEREVEPYSYRMKTYVGEVLYAFDIQKGEIRCFSLSGIEGVIETMNEYEPRWIVEVGEYY